MGTGELHTGRSRAPANFLRLSQLRKLRGCEQVAAVCYRVGDGGIEFLLVQTRGGRWIFPKGGVESGLTHAQAAALEAFEEAGVHGRMEEASFARYSRSKRGDKPNSAPRSGINAHLCEVLRLGPPQESKRNPTWFSAEKAKRRLRENRAPDYGAELARVVDRAVSRIQRLHSETSAAVAVAGKDGRQKDALQKVQFEAFEEAAVYGRMEASFIRYIRQRGDTQSAVNEFAVNAYLHQVLRHKVLRSGPARELNGSPTGFSGEKAKRLRADNTLDQGAELARVVEIDNGRGRAKGLGKKNQRNRL
jgi:8-oxo-dGTP pyrophosphatase MutT (NUDIX family)